MYVPFFPLHSNILGVLLGILIDAFHFCVLLASLKSKVQRNKMATAGELIEFRCLIRATDGKKTISTSVCSFDNLYSLRALQLLTFIFQN